MLVFYYVGIIRNFENGPVTEKKLDPLATLVPGIHFNQ